MLLRFSGDFWSSRSCECVMTWSADDRGCSRRLAGIGTGLPSFLWPLELCDTTTPASKGQASQLSLLRHIPR